MTKNIFGKKIIISGGSSGIGLYLGQKLSEKGAKIISLDIEELNSSKHNIQFQKCDVSNSREVSDVVETIFDDNFVPDVIINNAGLIHSELLCKFTDDGFQSHEILNWKKVLSVNLDGVFYLTNAVILNLTKIRRSAVFINISSICAEGNAGQSAYSASKAGVNALTKTWSKELSYLGNRFNAISPGFIDTESTRRSLSNADIKHIKTKVPLKRLGDLNSIYQSVEFCILNEYLNGEILNINGGLTLLKNFKNLEESFINIVSSNRKKPALLYENYFLSFESYIRKVKNLLTRF